MKTYRDWEILESMPDGWMIDKTLRSPLRGHEFITNGKSVLNGQKRSLLRVNNACLPVTNAKTENAKVVDRGNHVIKEVCIIDEVYVRTVNNLARKKFEQRLLNDIRVDLVICDIEGWDKLEYIEELKFLIGGLGGCVK